MKFSSRGIVIGVESFGEADCYVQFFTQKWGVISALAKSAKKSKRRYVGGLDLFCHDEIFLRGDPKDRCYLQELSVLNSFQGLRDSLDKLLQAGKAISWVKKLANTATPMPGVYSVLGQTLSLLEKETDPKRQDLLLLIFKLKLLSHIGLKPRMESCVRCSNAPTVGGGIFDVAQGGILCRNCVPHHAPNELSYVSENERAFLDVVDGIKLTLWEQIQFPQERILPIQRMVTQFASYHTHTGLVI